MKTLLAALFCGSALAHADLVIVQQVEGGGQSGEQTIRIKGEQVRADVAQQISTITGGPGGDIITLMHGPKTFLKISAVKVRAMLDQMQKVHPGGAPAKLTATGRKEKVAGYDCEIFTANYGTVGVTYWIASGFPDYQPLLAQMAKLQAGSISAMGRGQLPELKDFPGMPIRTVMDMDGKKVSTLLTSVKEEKVDAAIFDIPQGYQDVNPPPLKPEK